MEISYRRTNPSSLQSQSKAKSRLTVSYEAKATTGMPVQNRFPSYADLTWETIEEYLKPQFPTWTAYNAKHIGDSWVFELPKLLSNADHQALQELRDEHLRKRRDSVTPEPEESSA